MRTAIFFALLILASCGRPGSLGQGPTFRTTTCTLPSVESIHTTGLLDPSDKFTYTADVASDGSVITRCSVDQFYPARTVGGVTYPAEWQIAYLDTRGWLPNQNELAKADCLIVLSNGSTLSFSTQPTGDGNFAHATIHDSGQPYDGDVYSIANSNCVSQ